MVKVGHKPSVAFERWRFSIQTAADINQLMLVVAAYLSGWSADDLQRIPPAMAAPIRSTPELMARAVELTRFELSFDGPSNARTLVRELSLTISFAASRMRYLQSLGMH